MSESNHTDQSAKLLRLSMGVQESKELARIIIHREIIDDSGEEFREPTPWERIIFCMRRSVAADPANHELWMAFLHTPTWVHYLKATYLDDWLYYPVKKSHYAPDALGKKIGEWFGKSRITLDAIANDPALAAELMESGFEPYDDAETLDFLMEEVIKPYQSKILNHRAIMIGRCSKIAAVGSPQDAISYFSGFATGQKTSQQLLKGKAFEISKEREFAAQILSDEWEQIERMASRSEVRDYVASRLPARMRRSLSSDSGSNAFNERMLALFKLIGLNLTGRGKPPQNGSKPD